MKYFVTLLDSRPRFSAGGCSATLLQLPVGGGSLLEHLAGLAASGLGAHELCVLPCTPVGRDYAGAIERTAADVSEVFVAGGLRDVLERCEPSDALVVIDARHVLLGDYSWRELNHAAAAARGAAHLVATEDGLDRAQECTWHDENGDVQRVQRYYSGVTLVRTQTVFCTLMSGAAARMIADEPFESARQLRQVLVNAEVASRDVVTNHKWLDVNHEHSILSFSGRRLIARGTADAINNATLTDSGSSGVHPNARIGGTVEVQPGATIEAGAIVIGPAIVAEGSRISSGAIVARSIIGPGITVPAGNIVRQRVVMSAGALEIDSASDGEPAANFTLMRRAYAAAGPPASKRAFREPRSLYPTIKALIEAGIAAIALVMLFPLFVLVAAAIKFDSRGPIFFGHGREGRGGNRFKCWKFRTMCENADAQQRKLYQTSNVDGPQFKMRVDPRVTRVGRILRETNIDELPQLFNVLMMQMSLIGPRPSPFRENQVCVEWREARLSVRPGITGLWQVCRSNRDSSDFHQWISYDIAYVRHMSPLLDLRIILATITTLGGRKAVTIERLIPGYHEQHGPEAPRFRDIPILSTEHDDEAGAACLQP